MEANEKHNLNDNSPYPKSFDVGLLIEIIRYWVKEEVNKLLTNQNHIESSEDDWIGTKELIKITGLSKANIYQKSFHRSFPFPVYKSGKKLRFKRSEVLAALNRQLQTYEFEANAKERAENYLVNGKIK